VFHLNQLLFQFYRILMSLQTIYLVNWLLYGSLLTVPQLCIVVFCIMTLFSLVGWSEFHLENEGSMFL